MHCRVVLMTNASNFRKYLRKKNIVEKSHSCLGIMGLGGWHISFLLLNMHNEEKLFEFKKWRKPKKTELKHNGGWRLAHRFLATNSYHFFFFHSRISTGPAGQLGRIWKDCHRIDVPACHPLIRPPSPYQTSKFPTPTSPLSAAH